MAPKKEEKEPSLIWVYSDSLDADLDAATWLETTKNLRQMGWRVSLIHAGPPDLTHVGDVEVTSIPKPDIYLVKQVIFHLKVLREVVRRWRTTDVVLFHQMSAPWLLPLRFVRPLSRQGKPLIVMDTRTAPMIPKEFASARDRLKTYFDTVINRIANHLADGQTAITFRMAEMMRIPEKQLMGVWPSGVNLDLFEEAYQTRKWDAANEQIHLIYVGALHHPRNLMNFCRAVVSANEKYLRPRFVFTIVGDGTEREELEAYAVKTGGCIRVHPPVPHEQIPSFLAKAHIGVLPFPDQERFRVSSPIKLFEYMASRMPIVATHIDCHTDVVGEDDYAFWAYDETVEGLELALDEAWQQRKMLANKGQNAAAAALKWTWAASARKLDMALLSGLSECEKSLINANYAEEDQGIF